MQALLATLNSMPGVMGSMVCDAEGRLRAHAFPEAFAAATLQEVATVVADGALGLETVTGRIDLVDLRYGETRLVVKPLEGGLVVLLCGRSANVPLLGISISVATKKLEKLLHPPEARAAPAPAPRPAPPAVQEPPAAPRQEAEAAPEEPADGKKRKKPKTSWFPSV